MKKILLTFLLLSIVTLTSVYAQSRKITGTVIGADDGKPLPGVSVKITGTNLGVQTNVQGAFSLTAPAGATTLTFSYLGYLPQTVKITGTIINVSLAPDSRSLNEVVVTGYGVEKKREITGAISSIKGSDFADQPVQTLDRAIQGRAAGVQVTSTGGGQPGGGISVQIRGVATVNGTTQPLYIIDGVQLNSGTIGGQTSLDALSSINPDDIESIEILKDAASSAIYGALAANGVVLITTKHGKSGKTQINASVQFGRAQPYNPYKTLTGAQWVQEQNEAFINVATRTNASVATATTNAIASYSAAFPGGVVPAVIPTYDWVKAINQTGKVSQYDLSLSGGDAKTQFFISGSYNNTGGTILNSLFQRGTLRGSVTNAVSDKFSVVSSFSLTGSNVLGSTSTQGFFTNAPFTGAELTPPVNAVFNADGTYNTNLVGRNSLNEVQNLALEQRTVGTLQTVDNLALIYKIIPELSFKAFGGLDFSDVHDFNYRPATLLVAASSSGNGFEDYVRNINYNVSGTFNFSKKFGDHSLSAIAGFEYRSVTQTVLSASASGFTSPLLNLLSNASTPASPTSTFTGYKTAGFLGNISYKYKDKYFLTLNGRDDGSSRFGVNNRFGLFYGASAGWDMTKEDFMKNVSFITQLKPRVSYGVVGELPQLNFGSLALYSSIGNLALANPNTGVGSAGQYQYAASPGTPFPSGLQGGLGLTQLPVPNLSWERSAQADIGLDFALFNNRVTGSFDVYRKTNTQLILNQQVPGDTGFTSITQNSGSAKSEGYDIQINTVNVDAGGFKWVTSFNLAYNRTKLLSLYNGVQQINTFQYVVGQPLNLIYGPKWAGVNPADGRGMYYDIKGNITYNPKTADQFILGHVNPDFIGGFANTVSYKGLSLDFMFQYQYGNSSILQAQLNSYENLGNADNKTVDVLTRWTAPGQIAYLPRAYNGTEPLATSQGTFSSRVVDVASYIRLKTATLNYTIPSKVTQHIGIAGLTVFVQGLNLLTFTNFRGDDPENTGNNLNFYPNERTLTAGIKAKF
ncbi:MAG TPA: TonB-dependent receptor [Mucilaginibacter sp.]|jgi:TonB-linked SusC/RagA family outer membrane protein|nr:TonB-dependent receptor [Mucilaginibacter sp.]